MKIIRKILTFKIFRRDPVTRKSGPVLATLRGWDAIDAFLKEHGTE